MLSLVIGLSILIKKDKKAMSGIFRDWIKIETQSSVDVTEKIRAWNTLAK